MESSPPKTLQLLHLTASLQRGGTEQMLARTLPKLTEFSHTVVCLGPKGEVGAQLERAGIAVFYLSGRYPLLNVSAIRSFRNIARTIRPDLLITYLPLADLFGKLYGTLFGIKIIICSLRSTLRDLRYIPLIWLERITDRFATHYLAVSHAVKERFVSFGISAQKITVIPNGISISHIPQKEQEDISQSIRHELHISPHVFIIGVVGNLRKERGQSYVIQSFKDVLPKLHHPCQLLLIGDGPERSKLERLVDLYNLREYVQFLGFRNDVEALLQACDIVISSSLYEGMSNALLEAMAASRAIIAMNVPENRELITDKSSGLLVNPKSVSQLCEAILLLAADPALRKKFGQAAYMQIQQYSIENTITLIPEFLERFSSQSSLCHKM